MIDRRLKKYRLFLLSMLVATGFAMFFVYKYYVIDTVPDKILLRRGQEEKITFQVPVTATMAMPDSSYLETPIATSVSIVPGEASSYTMDLKYMGIIPLKSVNLNVVSGQEIAISGIPVGIYVRTSGVLVIDTGSYVNLFEEEVAPSEDILQPGDNILKVDGIEVAGKRQFVNMIENADGDEMVLTILRNGEESEVKVTPCQNEEGIYKIGVWVRDSAQGIGTLSYITKDGEFAALGHGVNDADIGSLIQLKKGSVYETNILGIRKADDSHPGELTGVMTFDSSDYVGKIEENTSKGIFGTLSESYMETERGKEFLGDCVFYPVALKQEVERGPAQIYCCIEEASAFYDIMIDDVIYNPSEANRGIMLTITDPQLLMTTGGIVQGMSGSPIVQNGKVVGVVTHVLVKDSTRGYGIFIEEMLGH
ncbi:MAG: SpoIVB peptidase [Lachnospiraceae bacterium]|nr:SpoIVB peptidase [Lachnospiraceae bacterium]